MRNIQRDSPQALKPKALDPLEQARLNEINEKRAELKRKEAEAAAKRAQGLDAKRQEMETVLQDANRALSILGKQSPGMVGSVKQRIGSLIPGTEAADLENLLTTVKSVSGFQKLQEMRDASPTGGALGQVSDFENKQLQSTIGNLDSSSSPAQRAENLKRVINKYLDIIHGPGQGPERYPLSFDREGKKPFDRREAYSKNEPVTDAARSSGKKFGMGEDKLKGIRQFPTKGKVVRKQHNKAENKTKLIYDNGEEVIVDGLK
jgi:hypothetical protein